MGYYKKLIGLHSRYNILLFLLINLTIGLAGCDYLSGGSDNTEPPTRLTKFRQEKLLKKLWTHKVGGGDYAEYLKLKPVIINNKIITVDAKGKLQARSTDSGDILWEKKLGQHVTSGVSGDNSKILLGTSKGAIVALDVNNGKELWKVQLDKNILNTPYYSDKDIFLQTTDGSLYSILASNGKINWEYKAVIPDLTLYSTSSPIAWKNLVVAGFSSGTLIAFDRATGMPKWEYQVAIPQGRSSIARMVDINARPLVSDDTLYIASYQGNMVAIDLSTGTDKWLFEASVINDFVMNNQYLYLNDTEGTVWALNKNNGRVLWRQQNLHMRDLSGTAYLDNTILVADYAGYLHGLASNHGGFVTRARASKGGIRVSPIVNNGIVYTLDNSGSLSALKLINLRNDSKIAKNNRKINKNSKKSV